MQPGKFLATVRTLICHKQDPLRSPEAFAFHDIHILQITPTVVQPYWRCALVTATRPSWCLIAFRKPDTTRVVPS